MYKMNYMSSTNYLRNDLPLKEINFRPLLIPLPILNNERHGLKPRTLVPEPESREIHFIPPVFLTTLSPLTPFNPFDQCAREYN